MEDGLVSVTSTAQNPKTRSNVTYSDTCDKDNISNIWINNAPAILGIANEWELTINVTEAQNTVTIVAQEKSSSARKEVETISLKADTIGPLLGAIRQPEVDANGNGTITGDTLELIGEVDTDAQRVCISHNDSQPAYCLKQFFPGSRTYRYLVGVIYGNVLSGNNKNKSYTYVALENASKTTT